MIGFGVGSWFENIFGGYYPTFRTDPRKLPEPIVRRFLSDWLGFFRSVIHALDHQPDEYNPSRPEQGLILPLLFEAVQDNLPKRKRPYLRCYQTIDSYLDLFHGTDYLFVLGGFLGQNDSVVMVDVTTDPKKIEYRNKNAKKWGYTNHLTISPSDVFQDPGKQVKKEEMIDHPWQIDLNKIENQGKKISRMLLCQIEAQEQRERKYNNRRI